MSGMVMVRKRKNGSAWWIESYEQGFWRWVGESGDEESAEQMRAQIEDVKMAYVDGRCGC